MKPVVDKLGSLYARVDVLEEEVATIREVLNRWKEMMSAMDIELNVQVEGLDLPVVDISPPNDWCIEYNPSKGVAAGVVQVGDPLRNKGVLVLSLVLHIFLGTMHDFVVGGMLLSGFLCSEMKVFDE
ncbi:hypothetical protein HAX54_036222 [Datura stramonium]|uniref:Uncharacterized protein n=1 Tax=Datura stramonium TaxID=4076 RepID=A0ABS8VHR8_DATST|nr:hypothetical protein [Datura stramonium]